MKSELLCICFLSLLLEISECGLPPARQRGPLPGCTFDCPPDAHHGQACGPGCVCLQDMYNLLAFACVHRSSTQDNLEPVISPDATVDMETTESAPVKRRLNEGDVASQQRPTQEDQGQWRVAGPKKPRGAGRLRSSSLSRGGDGTTP
ncbi:hypothetical protein MTO96_004613 [Rhipicephalus appendiculatus]